MRTLPETVEFSMPIYLIIYIKHFYYSHIAFNVVARLVLNRACRQTKCSETLLKGENRVQHTYHHGNRYITLYDSNFAVNALCTRALYGNPCRLVASNFLIDG